MQLYRNWLAHVVLLLMVFSTGAFAEQVHLRIYGNYTETAGEAPARAVLHSYLRMYEELNPHVTIEDLGRDHNLDRVTTMLITDTAPDLLAMGTHHILQLYANGLLPEVPGHFADRLRAEFFPVAIQGNSVEGRLIGIPGQNNVTGLFYNRRVMAESGLEEGPPDTWDELAQSARRTARFGPDQILETPGLQLSNEAWQMNRFGIVKLWSLGGDLFDSAGRLTVQTPEMYEVFQTFGEWTQTFASLTGTFAQGEVAFHLGFPFTLPGVKSAYSDHYEQDVRVARMPAGPAGAMANQYGNTYAVPRGPNEDEVWRLLEWLYFSDAGPEGMSPMTDVFLTRGYPPIRSADVGALSMHEDAVYFQGFLQNLEVARNSEVYIEHGIITLGPLGNNLVAVINGSKSPVQAVNDMELALRNQIDDFLRE